MAREFAARGRHLALCARRIDRLEELRDELTRRYPGVTVAVRQLDVLDHDQVFTVFRAFRDELGGLDRVIVNAGIGNGQPIGTGRFDANRRTAMTNFVAALAQCEAAMEIFREQRDGHLVAISSVAGLRGLPGNSAVYSASKAALATLAESIRADLHGTRIKVTTIHPGFIRTPINEDMPRTPFAVDAETGCRALVRAIEREPATAYVPSWPWTPVAFLLRRLPLPLLARVR